MLFPASTAGLHSDVPVHTDESFRGPAFPSHRRVRLIDILDYQQRSRQVRGEALARMAEDAGLYEKTRGAPIRNR